MNFHDLQTGLQKNFELMQAAYGTAFRTDAVPDELWEIYLETFPARINPIYRTRREFDCSCCRHFIKAIGGVVLIDNSLNVHTLWEFKVFDPDYQVVLDALDSYVKSRHIVDVYLSNDSAVGTARSHEHDENGNVKEWEHFFLRLPREYQHRGGSTIDTELNRIRSTVQVFKRSLTEITPDAIDTVLDLIRSNTLYRGTEWQKPIEQLLEHKNAFEALPAEKRDVYAWAHGIKAGPVLGRIRNHSIGVLLTDVSSGMELNEAVTRYEKIVAPANYKRPKAIFTARMLEAAKKTVTDLGYMDSLQRRYARLDDITVNNILFSNRDASKRIKGGVFDEMLSDAKAEPRKFDRVEEISIDRFITDVLPGVTELEAYIENRHAQNMVSLIAPVSADAPSMFKWSNPFSWAYTGNIADSDIRENVKNAGGNVDGVLRFSIQWNDTGEYSTNDLDAHCMLPAGRHIFFANKVDRLTGGSLDVDITHPRDGVPAVENITWPDKSKMIPGCYQFLVHQYANRGGRDGFRAEIAFDGKTYAFDYRRELRQNESVNVAAVTLGKDGKFSIKEQLPSTMYSKDVWGIKTMTFVPVTVMMYSPNYWDGQNGIGNKHYMFMLSGCVNPEKPNGFYNEFLKQELVEHKRVFEALGSKMAVELVDDQLSGVGFSSTLRNELIVKVKGATERIMKIKF